MKHCTRARESRICRGRCRFHCLFAAMLGLSAVALGGCGKRSAPVRVAVRGDVRLDGRPLPAAVIAFHCGEGDKKLIALGVVENGTYQLEPQKGPLVGHARVQFHPKPIAEEEIDAVEARAAQLRQSPQYFVMYVPPQYGEQSPLAVDVVKDGENKFDFDLRSVP